MLKSCAAQFGGFCLVAVCLLGVQGAPVPKVDYRKVPWQEPEGLTEKVRMVDRPGNFNTLKAIANFLDDIYQLHPKLSDVAYPFTYTRDSYAVQDDLELQLLKEMGRNQFAVNAWRRDNWEVRSLTLFDLNSEAETSEFKDATGQKLESDFKLILKSHNLHKKARSFGAIARIDLYSLQSDKIQKQFPCFFHIIHQDQRWQVAAFNGP